MDLNKKISTILEDAYKNDADFKTCLEHYKEEKNRVLQSIEPVTVNLDNYVGGTRFNIYLSVSITEPAAGSYEGWGS